MLPIYVVALSALALVSSGSHALIDTESAEVCIAKFEEAIMKEVEVPARVAKLIQDLRAMHPELSDHSLIEFADNAPRNLRVEETGLVSAGEVDEIAEMCAEFVSKIYPSGEKPCDLEVYIEDEKTYAIFLGVASKHQEFDTKMGTARLCVQML